MKKWLLILIAAGYSSLVQAQSAAVHNLVFEGAGMKGIAYAGAIAELEQHHILKDVKRVGGTSAGAITALLLSLGYTSHEISDIIGKTNFKKFNDGQYLFAGGISRLKKEFGWYRGNKVETWLEKLIEAKTGNADITFLQLKEKGFKELYVTGTSLTRQRLLVFSHESFPHMKVKDAVRISMSIPFYFEAVFMDSTGAIIDRPAKDQPVEVMVDGGFTGNFPIHMFDSTRYVSKSGDNEFYFNEHTLGFRVDHDAQIKSDANGKGLAAMPITNLKEYTRAFYNMIMENLNRQSLTDEDWSRTVSISNGDIGPRIRKLSKAEIDTLVENGREAAATYLTKNVVTSH
jgi:NTE family protein